MHRRGRAFIRRTLATTRATWLAATALAFPVWYALLAAGDAVRRWRDWSNPPVRRSRQQQ